MLETRRRVLEAARPGVSLGRLHQISVRLLSEGPGVAGDPPRTESLRAPGSPLAAADEEGGP